MTQPMGALPTDPVSAAPMKAAPVLSETKPTVESECEAARDRLLQTGYGCLAQVAVSSQGAGHLRIDGCVPTFYLKQVAQEALLQLGSLQRLDNALTVAQQRPE